MLYFLLLGIFIGVPMQIWLSPSARKDIAFLFPIPINVLPYIILISNSRNRSFKIVLKPFTVYLLMGIILVSGGLFYYSGYIRT